MLRLSPHGALTLGLAVVFPLTMAPTPAAVADQPNAARSATTTISGFPQLTKRVAERQKVHFKVKVQDRTRAPRSVKLQERVGKRWRTKVTRRTNARGAARLQWRAPERTGATRLRIVVAKKGRSAAAMTAVRKIVIVSSASTKTSEKLTESERFENQVFKLLNKARSQTQVCGEDRYPAVPKLTRNAKLDRAARKYAQRMADEKFFDHISPDGDDPTDRARAEGYRRGVGENIAAGYENPEKVMEGFLNSPGHCANLMRRSYVHLGIGFVLPTPGESAPFSNYWVQNFG